jgi:3-oxoacyl-[acyl-carrier protein] reductase
MRMVLTGCASGMGRHLAGALAKRGHRLLATDVDEAGLEKAAKERGWRAPEIVTRKLDVRSEGDWEAAMDAAERELGGVDVVLNIAGYLRPAYVKDFTQKDLDLHFDVNCKGLMLGTRAAARRMIPKGQGHIINIGSLASLAPVPGLSLYSASKFAVRGFTLAAATELKRHGIAVSLVLPDAVDTAMLDLQVGYEEAALTFSGDKPLTVEDIERIVIDKVLPQKPLEVGLPAGRWLLARVANTSPGLSQSLIPALLKKGRKKQEAIKGRGR